MASHTEATSQPRSWWLLVAVVVIVAAATAPKLRNGFAMDDYQMIDQGDFIHDPGNIPDMLTNPAMIAQGSTDREDKSVDTYRPLVMLTFFADAAISERSPVGYHLTNLILHLICVVLVVLLARRLLPRGSPVAHSAAGLVFGLNALTAEAHVWINGRSDALATVFILGALLLVLDARRSERSARRRVAAGALFGLACFAKETSICIMPLFGLIEIGWFDADGPKWRMPTIARGARRSVGILAGAATYFAVRTIVLSGSTMGAGGDWPNALARLGALVLDAMRWVIVPMRPAMRTLNGDLGPLPVPVLVVTSVALGGLVTAALIARRLPALRFGFLGFVLMLVPVTLVTLQPYPGFGRYLYTGYALLSIGLVELAVAAVQRLEGRTKARYLWIAAVAYFATLLLLYELTVRDYLSFEDSLMATFRDWPNSFQGQNTHGYRLLENGDASGALPYLERAFELHPTHDLVTYNLADAYWHVGDDVSCSEILVREVIVDGNRDRGFGRLARRCNNPQLPDQIRAAVGECTLEHGHEVCAERQDFLAESMGLPAPSGE